MALTDAKVKNAKPSEKQVKLTDGDGMYLLLTPAGGKCWRLKYRINGKEKVLSLGTYPQISLADARERREAARKQIAKGLDPGEVKKAQKAMRLSEMENTFEAVAREWHERFKQQWSERHAENILKRLEMDAFPG